MRHELQLSLLGTLFLLVIHYSVAVATQAEPGRLSMTPEEWKRYQARDKFAEAIAILDDPNWHQNDPWIQHFRAEDRDSARAAPERTRNAIHSRERDAMTTVIAQDLGADSKKRLLTKYLSHSNRDVSHLALVTLISAGMWSVDEGTAYMREKNPTVAGWHTLLTSLPQNVPATSRQEIARAVLMKARSDPPVYPTTSQPVYEIDAVQVLLSSKEATDHALIRWAARQYPDAPLLWAAVSRLPPDEETVRVAQGVYEDPSRPEAARFAAAMVFARDNPEIMGHVAQSIVKRVREFGSREYYVFWQERFRNPAEPTGAERFRRSIGTEWLLTAANELPAGYWRPHVNDLVRNPYLTLGAGVNAIVAKRLPGEFVQAVSTLETPPEDLDYPLSIALQQAPTLADRMHEVLSPARLEKVEHLTGDRAVTPVGLRNLTLWD